MPEFISGYTPIPFEKEFGSGIPAATPIQAQQPTAGGDPMAKLFAIAASKLPGYATPKSAMLTTPILTQLDKTLRYTDPELGFSPADYQLEYKYADAHPWQTLGNNVGQFGARFLGAATEAILTIPLAVNAVANKDFSKMYDNPVTNTISGWLDDLNIYMPTYRTEYEENHPLLKYLNIFNPTSLSGAWGGAINNLGYTAGAIAGALVEDAAITALTGGVGLLPALGANIAQLKRAFTTAGKMAVTDPQAARGLLAVSYPEGVQATRMLPEITQAGARGIPEVTTGARALMRTDQLVGSGARLADEAAGLVPTGGGAMIRGEGTGLYQSAGNVDDLINARNAYAKRVDFRNSVYKITDGVRYNLALLTSASAEGAFEAAEVRKRGIEELSERYKEQYGSNPYGEDLEKIKRQSKEAANFTMGTNIALLYLSNRVNWGSLFKPTNQALTEGITGWGKNIARTGTAMEWKAVKNEAGEQVGQRLMHSVVNKVPESRIGKILLNGEKVLKIGSKSINESLEEASQFTVSEASLDYIKNKYNPYNLKQVGDHMKSFNEGLGKTFGSNEGWDNIIGGFIGGILGGGVMRAIQKPLPLSTQLANQTALLNTSTFADVIQGKITENATSVGLAQKHTNAVVKGDTYAAKNLKFDMLYNWVTSGLKASNYEKRMEELRMAEDLTDKSFQEYWGVEDTENNRQAVSTYINGIKSKAENIKSNYEKVERITKNPHKRLTPDWNAFEDYKNELALNLSRHTEYQRRLKGVKEDLLRAAPLLDITTAIEMTSVQGISNILQKLQKASNDVATQIQQTEGNEDLQKDLILKKKSLDDIFARLQPIVYSGKQAPGSMRVTDVKFEGTEYVQALKDLYYMLNGVDLTNNKYIEQQKQITDGKTIFIDQSEDNNTNINDDEFADILQRLQDIYKLGDASYNIGKYYTYLRKGLGQTEYIKRIKEIIADSAKFVDENSDINTPEDIEDQIRQEEYEDIDPGETNSKEREILKTAAKKTVYDVPVTKEEQDIIDKHEEVFTNYVKAEQSTQKRVIKQYEKAATTPTSPDEIITENNQKFKITTPESLFFALYRNEKYLPEAIPNLHQLIFNTPIDEIGNNFTATIAQRPEGERKITPVNNFAGLYRKDFETVIQIFNNGKIIGELRPPESLFLDENGQLPLFDNTGKLTISASNYVEITGNPVETFEEFKQGAEAYFEAYNELYPKAETGATADDIKNLFGFTINPGSTIQNSKKYKDADTLIKDVKIKNKAVFSIKKQDDGTYEAELLKNFGITEQQIEAVQQYVRNNNEFFIENGLNNKMVGVFPVGGEILPQSFIRARFITDKPLKYVNSDTVKVTTTPQVFENFTINFRPKQGPAATKGVQTTVTTAITVTDAKADIERRRQESIRITDFEKSEPDVLDKINAKYDAELGALEQPTISTSVEKPILKPAYVKNKIELGKLLQSLFGYTTEQAKASAELFDANAKAWVNRNPGKTIEDAYARIGFGTSELFAQQFGENIPQEVQFSKEDQTKIQQEVEQLKNEGLQYPSGKTNLSEKDWFTTQTPTFKAWFNNGAIVDENGDPLVQYHFSPNEFEVFDLNRTIVPNANGMGAHFGTRMAAEDRKMTAYLYTLEKTPLSKQTANHAEIINNSNLSQQKKDEIITGIDSYIDNLDGQPLSYGAFISYLRTTQFLENENQDFRQELFNIVEKIADENNISLPKGKIYSVFLNSQKLLNIPDEGEHYLESYKRTGTIEQAFNAAGITTPTLKEEISALKTAEDFNNLLNKYGFDGVVYENVAEDAGRDSYLITQRNRIKSVDSAAFDNINNSIYYQQRTFPDKVAAIIKGFGLKPKYGMGGKMFAGYVTKSGKVTQELVKSLKDWVDKSDITGVQVIYNPNTSSIFLKNTQPKQTTLFQGQNLIYDLQIENENQQVYVVFKNDKYVGTGSIELLPDNQAKVSFFKNESDIKGLGLNIFKDLTQEIKNQGFTPVVDQYITGYGYNAMQKLAKEGYLTFNNIEQLNPQDKPYKEQDYGENKPFSYAQLEQPLMQEAKGAYDTLNNIIYALTNPDITTFPHELAHAWEEQLNEEERQTILDWAGTPTWTRETSETFAKGFEVFLAEGNKTGNAKMDNLFKKFAKWLADTLDQLKQALGIQLNDKMRNIYAQMLDSQYVAQETKNIITAAQPVVEVVTPVEEVTPQAEEYEIVTQIGISGENEVTVVDQEGNIILNPNSDFGSFDTIQEAQAFINELTAQKPVQETVQQTIVEKPIGQEAVKGITLDDVNIVRTEEMNIIEYNGQEIGAYYEQNGKYVDANAKRSEAVEKTEGQTIADILKKYNATAKPIEQVAQASAPKTTALTLKDVSVPKTANENDEYPVTNKNTKEVIGYIYEQNGEWIDPTLKASDPQAYLGDTKQDATQAIIDKYNEENNLITQGEYADEYYTFNLGRAENRKTIVGKLLDINGSVYKLQDKQGNIFEVTDKKNKKDLTKLKPATKQEFDEQPGLEMPKPKYKLGDKVVDDEGVQQIIENIEIRQVPNTTNFEVAYVTNRGVLNENDIKGLRTKTQVEKAEFKSAEHKQFNDKLQRVAQRFQNLFNDTILFETGYYEFKAPARFYKGKVQINLDYVNYAENIDFNEAVAHEFMHPFVLALKLSNKELYNNLIKQLKDKHQNIIREVEENEAYLPEQKLDEALTKYLGRELSKGFNKDGTINIDYIAKNTLLNDFIEWLRDIVDFLLGKRKPKTLEQFVRDANIDRAQQVQNTKKEIKRLEEEYPEFKNLLKKQDKFSRKADLLLKNKKQVEALLPQQEYDNLYNRLEDYKDEVSQIKPRFEFIVEPNFDNYVTFDTKDEANIKVYIDPTVGLSINNIANILLQNKNKLGDQEIIDEYEDLIGRNFYIDTSKATPKEMAKRELVVSQIDPTLQLQQVSDFLLYQISDPENRARANELFKISEERNLTPQEAFELNNLNNQHTATNINITFTENEMSAIDTLEAYMSLGEDVAAKTRKKILKKMPTLKESAEVRFKSDILKLNYNRLNALDRDIKDDTEFVLQYFEEASRSITAAYRKYYEIIEDVRERKGKITKAELSRLNRELASIRQLLGFYEEFKNFTRVEVDFKNEEEVKLNAQFYRTIGYLDAMREGMQDAAIDLTVEWLTPYMQEHNRYMEKQGYTDERYVLTPKVLYDHFKYGVGEDTNFVTYWLGTNITSRNPINALFANTLSDSISFNNIDTFQDSTTINIAFKEFLTEKGIGNNDRKAQIDYYKKHYLRKAKVPYRKYDEITDDYEDTTIEKWALHQEFYWDKYQLDLKEIEKKYKNPKNQAEEELFAQKVREWKIQQGFTQTKDGKAVGLTNPKYINKDYQNIKNDKFFKVLEKYYNDGNDRYGENRLDFGIIPQKYDVSFWDKFKDAVGNIKDEKTIVDKFNTVKQNIRNTLGTEAKNVEQLNLDGTMFKSINSNLTKIKNEENLSLDLQELLIDFTVESRKYSVLKDTQHSVDTLMLLLEGNEKFNIPKRKFAQADYTRKLTDANKLDAARKKIKELDEAKANGVKIDEEYYKKVKERIQKGVQEEKVWDKFLGKLLPAKTNRSNEMLINQINDYYYGIQQEDFDIKGVSARKLAHYLSLYTSLNSMAGNITAAVGNVSIGNLQMFIEAHGGKYYTKKDLGKALADFTKNAPTYISDLNKPIKSKDNQLLIMLDAMQGDIEDEFGRKITGNISRRLLNFPNNLFFLTTIGEYQIQTVNMKAMLYGRKVKTNSGQTISLYDAFVADKDGRYSLRTDIDFTKEDLAKFMRDLHGVNRDLNGNYSDFNKVELQRKWYGNLAMKFRKYLYSTYRSRWASESVNFEKNTVEVGYLRYFYGTYLPGHIKNLLTRAKFAESNGAKPHEAYALRKAAMETGIYIGITILAMAAFGDDEDEDKKQLSLAEKQLVYYMNRLQADLQTYNGSLPNILLPRQKFKPLEEPLRQLKNPTASLRTITDFSKFTQQLFDYDEVYQQSGPGYSKGDNKLYKRSLKLIPGRQFIEMLNGEFEENIDGKLGYFELINKNIEGVSPRQSLQ